MQTLLSLQQVDPGLDFGLLFDNYHSFSHPDSIITLHPFTLTANSGTAAFGNLGGRPCMTMVGGGSAANGHNMCYGTAALLPIAGKRFGINFSYYSEAMGVSAFTIGLHTVGTTISEAWKSGGTPPANSVALVKRATETKFTLRSQKASGGAQSAVIEASTLSSSVWYDYCFVFTPSTSTAGQGTAQLWRRAYGIDSRFKLVSPHPVTFTGLPDTVATALGFQFQAGDTGTTLKDAVSYLRAWQEF